MKIAVVTTHPIQYQVPWLQRLAAREDIDLHVYFAMLPDGAEQGREFGVAFAWDLPLLEGYRYTVLENRATNPSLTEFAGCDTPQIHSEIRRGRFDAVIVNGWVAKTCLQALWACLLTGTPCIVRGEVNGLRPRARWKRVAHRLLLARYAAVLCIGRNNRRYCEEAGVPARRLFDTPYCVDNQRFAASAKQWGELGHNQLCVRFGLATNRVTYLFSGKFVAKKRPADILSALRQALAQGNPMIQVLMVGDGPLAHGLREQAAGLPVCFAGFLNQGEIGAAYAVADCLVLPSDHGETWGLVVNEAMACGLPALVSDQVGCAADLVTPGVTGDVFRCGDVAALAQLFTDFGCDRERLGQFGNAARARVIAHYNFECVVAGVNTALRAITTGVG